LIQFDLSDFDSILGMNWLRTYEAKIHYKDLKVILNDDKGWEVSLYGHREEKRHSLFLLWKQVSCCGKDVLGTGVTP